MTEPTPPTLDDIVDRAIDQVRQTSVSEIWTPQQLLTLARAGVRKVDLLGPRGITLCTMNEIEAMAGMLVLSGVLLPRENGDFR